MGGVCIAFVANWHFTLTDKSKMAILNIIFNIEKRLKVANNVKCFAVVRVNIPR